MENKPFDTENIDCSSDGEIEMIAQVQEEDRDVRPTLQMSKIQMKFNQEKKQELWPRMRMMCLYQENLRDFWSDKMANM